MTSVLSLSLKRVYTSSRRVLTNVSGTCTIMQMSSYTTHAPRKLRIGYIPEHFSTPLHFAHDKFGLRDVATLTPYPSGTGTMIEAFRAGELDIGIGLTEAWVAGLGKEGWLSETRRAEMQSNGTRMPYRVAAAYTLSPLRWAISTGAKRSDVTDASELNGKKVGISRYGSGSHIMAQVFADKQGWLANSNSGASPFDFVVCGPFAPLRAAVTDGTADFFMWEHFTTKRWCDSGELKKIGEIPTPWNAWHVAVAGHLPQEPLIEQVFPALTQGVQFFKREKKQSVDYICEHMEYSREDADEWYGEVKFPDIVLETNEDGVVSAIRNLKKAGVLDANCVESHKLLTM